MGWMMYTLYCADTSTYSLLQSIGEEKCIALKNKTYRFYIQGDTLFLDILFTDSNALFRTMEVEKNVKSDFDVHTHNNDIHIVVANKNYDLMYQLFDGESLTSETIYSFDPDIGIPSNPVIKAQDHGIYAAVSFIRIKKPRAWQIRSFTKKRGIWKKRLIDKGPGLCYTQHCLSGDSKSNIHCLYKYCDDKTQDIKYACLNTQTLRWSKPKAVYNNGKNKYSPHIFINLADQVYFIWLEISDKVQLCVARNTDRDYDKLDITTTVQNVTIWNDRYHIYAMSSQRSSFFYDLCCYKQERPKKVIEFPGTRREVDMDTAKVKLFLDTKRELEQRVLEMEEALKSISRSNAIEIDKLLQENISYKNELTLKNKRIEELSETLGSHEEKASEADKLLQESINYKNELTLKNKRIEELSDTLGSHEEKASEADKLLQENISYKNELTLKNKRIEELTATLDSQREAKSTEINKLLQENISYKNELTHKNKRIEELSAVADSQPNEKITAADNRDHVEDQTNVKAAEDAKLLKVLLRLAMRIKQKTVQIFHLIKDKIVYLVQKRGQ